LAVTVAVVIRLEEPRWFQGVNVEVPPIYALVVAAAVALLVVLGVITSFTTPTRFRLWSVRASVLATSAALVVAVAGTIGIAAVAELPPTWWLAAWPTAGVGLYLGPASGLMRLTLRRRKGSTFSSSSYVPVHRPVNEDAREDLEIWIEEREQSARREARRQARRRERAKNPKRPAKVRRR
jgi:hypothetical protein